MSAEPFISCRAVIDFLIDYVGDELDAESRRQFERHLAVCPSCRAYLKTYQTTLRLERKLSLEATELPEDLVRAVLMSRRSH